MKRFQCAVVIVRSGVASFQSSTVPAFVQAADRRVRRAGRNRDQRRAIPMRILVQSPADTESDLQIICCSARITRNSCTGRLLKPTKS